jgi:hypothetical protein
VEILDQPGWLWGMSLIVLTIVMHATAVVILAFVMVGIKMRLQTRGTELWSLIAILISVIGVIGTAVGGAPRNGVRDLGSGVFVAGRRQLSHGLLALFGRLDEHARRIGADTATTLADNGRA